MSRRRRYRWVPEPLRPTFHALRFLFPSQQRRMLEFWRSPAYYSRGEPTPKGYELRDAIYALEKAIHQKDTSALIGVGPLLPRFAKWGLYRVLTAHISEVATEIRELETHKAAREAEKRHAYDARLAAKQAKQAATRARITELLGDPHTKATFIHFPNGHITPGVDTVVYLPEAPDYEPDPDRPGILAKSPALAIHLTSNQWSAKLDVYMSGSDDQGYHGIDVLRRLKAAHPELFAPEQPAPEPHASA